MDVGSASEGRHTIRIVLNIGNDGGKLIATLQTPDESPAEVPADSVELKGDALTVKVNERQSTIEATLNTEGAELDGRYKQPPYDIPLSLKRSHGS